MNYLKYQPSEEEMEDMALHYWEVWQGIPELEYQNAKAESGKALRYDKDGHYIWIPPAALKAHTQNPETIYLAMMHKNPNNKIRAIWLEPKTDSLEDVASLARKLNRKEILEEVIKSARKTNQVEILDKAENLAKRLDKEEENLAKGLNRKEILEEVLDGVMYLARRLREKV